MDIPSRDGGSPSVPVTVTSAARSPRESASRTAAIGSTTRSYERPRRIAAGPHTQVPAGALLAVAADAEGARVHVLREVEDERDDDGPQEPVDLAGLAADGLDERIGHEARADAVRDRVRERHDDHGEQSREALLDVAEVDLGDDAGHQEADDHQRRRRR